MIEKVLIEGIEFPLNPETDAFIDGHVYCKECGEQLDLEPINLLGNIHIFVNDTLRMYKSDDIRMYNFDCITDTIVEVITTCNTYTLLTVHLL